MDSPRSWALPFKDRAEAGRWLGEELRALRGQPGTVVLALPRGGVEVAEPVARVLELPLDVYLVRKLGAPGHPELAIGAIAEGAPGDAPIQVLNHALIDRLGLSQDELEGIIRREESEIKRRQRMYRGERPPPALKDQTVIIVDDGAATGYTMLAAIEAIRRNDVSRIVAAVPVASQEALKAIDGVADQAVRLAAPSDFEAVGTCYLDFAPVLEEKVITVLAATQA